MSVRHKQNNKRQDQRFPLPHQKMVEERERSAEPLDPNERSREVMVEEIRTEEVGIQSTRKDPVAGPDDNSSEDSERVAKRIAAQKRQASTGCNQKAAEAIYQEKKKLKRENQQLKIQLQMVKQQIGESKSSTTIVNPIQLKFHDMATSPAEIDAVEHTLKMAAANGQEIKREQVLSDTAREQLNWTIAMGTNLTVTEVDALPCEEFLRRLREVVPRDTTVASRQISLEEKIRSKSIKDWNGSDPLVIANYWSWIRDIIKATEAQETWDADRVETICDAIIKNISDGRHGTANKNSIPKSPANHLQLQMQQYKRSESLTAFGDAFAREAKKIMDGHAYGCLIGMSLSLPAKDAHAMAKGNNPKPYTKGNKRHEGNRNPNPHRPTEATKSAVEDTVVCHGCGRIGHSPETCKLKTHEHWNKNKEITWKQSTHSRHYPANMETLPFGKPKPGKSIFSLTSPKPVTSDMDIGNDDVKCSVRTLFDTGALQGNYGNPELANKLKSLGFT